MKQEVIDKLNLKATNIWVGEGFANDLRMYLWPGIIKGYKTYLSAGDANGRPMRDSHYSYFIVKPNGATEIAGTMNEPMILTVENDQLKQIMNDLLTHQL